MTDTQLFSSSFLLIYFFFCVVPFYVIESFCWVFFYDADDWTTCFSVEAHKEKLNELKQTLSEAQEKISSYEPQVENINTVEEADAYKQYLLGAMERIQRSKAKLLANQEFLQRNENVAMPSVNAENMAAAGNESSYSNA
ncbi:hypothetical protein H5410_031768 [Solanum commersonii]|uniref:Uncharacterized protein n=1 Tax=Solanum commersonii TaxID=4109 RepID=A0A9J5YNC4_SOLCO|nr:hypothetical protein H5410_031768 [Solanum commersonii]